MKTRTITKTTKKRKITKRKKKQQKYLGELVYFEVILMVILIPTIVLFLVPIFQEPLFKESHKLLNKTVYKVDNKNSVEVMTKKNIYRVGDEIVLSIKNNSNNSIYFEPCEYLDNFEKKINGVWVSEKSVVENGIYDSYNFKKEDNVTNCSVSLPKSGAGTYRAVIKIYYDCQTPGESMCSGSKVFYSNEFRVIGGENDFCEDKVLENCDKKRVSIVGTLSTLKSFSLNVAGRHVNYTLGDNRIRIIDSKGIFNKVEKSNDNNMYRIIGVISAGGQPCGMYVQECFDKNPTSIEVEKIYPIFSKAQ